MSGGKPSPTIDASAPELRSLPTPSLLLDADALERNLDRMDGFLADRDAWARPHTKTHKSPEIARRQMERPRTVGVCCARVSEAEAMVEDGVGPVLVTSPLTTDEKIERFVSLCPTEAPPAAVVVDSALGVERLDREAARRGRRCPVLIDLDPGFHRTGVAMGDEAVALARRVLAASSLELLGVQMYAGTLMHVESADERRTRSRALWLEATATRDAIRRLGVDCPVLTGGGTGTFDIDSELGFASDLQVGSYVFMDAQYRIIESPASVGATVPFDFFEPSLFVLASVVSRPVPETVTVDAGFKALSCDHVPEVAGHPAMTYHFAGDEHGIVEVGGEPDAFGLGDRMALLVSHCDPTVNLHDHFVVVRSNEIVDRWPVAARGIG